MIEKPYDRAAALEYAGVWAMSRNPHYPNFDGMGGDCTNFASQCLYAGGKVMNFTPVEGWFCKNLSNRTASWSSVYYLHRFLTSNRSVGPYGEEVPLSHLQQGDLIQLATAEGHFYHTLVVLSAPGENILVASHTIDSYNRPLSTYVYGRTRGIHILGIRKWG